MRLKTFNQIWEQKKPQIYGVHLKILLQDGAEKKGLKEWNKTMLAVLGGYQATQYRQKENNKIKGAKEK